MTDSEIVIRQSWQIGEAWRHPDICDSMQRAWCARLREAIDANQRQAFVQRWGRQVGKSWSCIAFALSEMQRRSGVIVRYAALTGKSCAAIVVPTFEALASKMPRSVIPKLNEAKGTITSPNGSSLVFAGTDNEQFDRLRGPRCHIIVLDESAFYADLPAVERALLPQLNTTNGIVVYPSSPPETPAHPWVQRDAAAQAAGTWSKATIYDSPRYSVEQIAGIENSEAQRLGLTLEQLKASTYWQREYLAQIVTEEARAALPAWTEEARAALVGEWERPKHFDGYVSADPGKTDDPHGTLWGFHDPATNTLTIEWELELRSAASHVGAWVDEIKSIERHLWGVNRWDGTLSGATRELLESLGPEFQRVYSESAPRQPFLRVSDNDARCTVDMTIQHGVAFLASPKHDKWQWVDTVNELIRDGRLRIHRRCTRLLEQMTSTLWNRTRSSWERTPRDHGDLVDCLTYMVRNVRWHRDCRPPPPVDRGLKAAMNAVSKPKVDLGLLIGRTR